MLLLMQPAEIKINKLLNKLNNSAKSLRTMQQKNTLANDLGCNSLDAFVISVSGTNGKGSVIALLESILVHAGISVAIFTSPHLLSVCERIRFEAKNIGDSELLSLLQHVIQNQNLSYFGALFFAAIRYFQRVKPQVVILEAGIGGVNDLINVIDADLVIITTVDLDHCDVLGDNIEKIAQQKAGLMRLAKPVIYADVDCPKSIIQTAAKLQCPLYRLNNEFHITEQDSILTWQSSDQTFVIKKVNENVKNIACAIMACALAPFSIPLAPMQEMLATFKTPGRKQTIVDQGRKVLLDVAHNRQAIQLLLEKLKEYNVETRIVALCVFKQDKEVAQCLALLENKINSWYLCDIDDQRMLTKETLARQLTDGAEVKLFDTSVAAYKQAKQDIMQDDVILVFGSFTIVGEILHYLAKESLSGL